MFLFFALIIWGMQTTSTSEENVTRKHRKREEWRSGTVPECEDNWDTGHVQKDNPTCNIRLQKLNKFSFLGKTMSSDTRSLHEIKIRIAAAKLAFTDKILITNKFLLRQDRVLDAYITPVLMHGSEVQTFFLKSVKTISAAEMWFIRLTNEF